MKKKTIQLALACMIFAAAAGCGKEDAGTDTEAVLSEGTEAGGVSADSNITYDVDEYVTLGDYMNVEVTLNELDYQVTEDAVNTYVDQTIMQYAPYAADASKTVVEAGDVVDVDYVGKKDGEAFEGGSAQNQYIDTSSNTNAATGGGYISGFADGLLGAKVGETIDHQVTFPEDYQSEDLKGQTVTFTFTINAICMPMKRESLNDEYVLANFGAQTVEDFYDDMKSYVEQDSERRKESDTRAAVIEAVTDKCEVTFPEGLLEARVEEYIANFQSRYCQDGVDLGTFLESNGTTEEEFRSQTKEYMETNLKQELVFEAIVKKEDIPFDQEDFDSYISGIMQNVGYASAEAVYEAYGSDQETGEKYLRSLYLANEACSKIVENVTVNYTQEDAGTENPVADTEG